VLAAPSNSYRAGRCWSRRAPSRGRSLDQLRQRAQAVWIVDGDVVRFGLEHPLILEAAEGARQNLRGGAALGRDEVAGLGELDSVARLELDRTGAAHEVDGEPLLTVNRFTGVASSVGDTGDYFAGLAFDGNGVLYGLTGNGGSNPRQLFTLDQTNGTPTPFLDISTELGAWQGVGLAYHPEDGMLYVTSGSQVLAVDPSVPSSTPVGLCRGFYYTANAATSLDATSLLLANDYGDLHRFDVATGMIGARVGSLDHNSKGLVFIQQTSIFADGFESGDTTAWSAQVGGP